MNNNAIKIRPLRVSDSENELKELFRQLTKREISCNIAFLAHAHNCYCHVIEHDDKLIAFAAITLRLVPTKGWVGIIEDVIVHENYRKQGIGLKMLTHLINQAKKLDLKIVELTSNPKRIGARRLYDSLGFRLLETGVFRLKLSG